ncbi:hypothetical protein [Archangium lansingense]|uniref:Uncharacterized protein n=1 Tax=Archangium lansingense TaxID=2995310 RepID=A0ABT4A6B5_9BACT|nr:hypothetical protein [Archangium lansinium]MCY1076539.1 hypothetical protein [Archangium lansinium]
MMDFIDKLVPFVCVTLALLFTAVLYLSFILEVVKIVREPVREFFQKLTIKRVISGVLGLLPVALVMGGLAWALLRPWIAPDGTPLERCLKGQTPREFLEEDRKKLELLWSFYHHHNDEDFRSIQKQSLASIVLPVEGQITQEQAFALNKARLDALFEERDRVVKYRRQILETACKEAASRIESTAPVAAPAEP